MSGAAHNTMQLSEKIKSIYPSFTKTEKIIADYFLGATPVSFEPDATLEEISGRLGVGQSTVMRFIHKCGYNSLRTFSIDLTTSIYLSDAYSRQSFRNAPNALISDVSAQITLFRENLDVSVIEGIAQKILSADVIICTGIGYSGMVAQLAAYRFIRSGFFAVQHTDQLKSWDAHTILKGKKAVVLVFSISGETTEVVDAVSHYSMIGSAYLASLTSFISSTVAKASDATIFIPAQKAPNSTDANVDGLINMLLAVESIIIKCFELKDKQDINNES